MEMEQRRKEGRIERRRRVRQQVSRNVRGDDGLDVVFNVLNGERRDGRCLEHGGKTRETLRNGNEKIERLGRISRPIRHRARVSTVLNRR